ncbi:hypothetical protein [Piscinibacter terrae]|uniref:Uncharacterized protein n=1 Tax=Piscinibacter terrae TaxID=2496871 RepID=A0A3N7HMT9_9BURK|nr:hypothetical protein [Albitalea terrae]RQP23488.1 hypothetical protein DZC73_15140 [Albitalea terrae]
MQHDHNNAFRLGAAMLSTVAGSILGLLVGAVLLYAGLTDSLSLPIAGGALAGVLAGAALPSGAMDFVEALVHFLIGILSAASRSVLDDADSSLFEGQSENSDWLRWAFAFGAMFAVVTWILLRIR